MTEDQLLALTKPVEEILRGTTSTSTVWAALYIKEYFTVDQVIAVYEYLTDSEADDHINHLIIEIVEILNRTK